MPDPDPWKQGVHDAFDVIREMQERPDTFPDDAIIIPLRRLLDEKSILSKQRVRLLLVLRDEGPFESVTALAGALDRPRARVSQDVSYLAALRLVERKRKGRRTMIQARHRHILIH